jgi:hypothetical protein
LLMSASAKARLEEFMTLNLPIKSKDRRRAKGQ